MIKKIILLAIFFVHLSCVGWGEYRKIILEPQEIGSQDVLVHGRSCAYLLFPPLPKLENAIRDAISKAPGKKGLKNPVIKDEFYLFVRCFSVEGYASDNCE
ncbi:hypothetical protein LEP1GSC195_2247 [Leptospira wolbachii serovar Codice str. CDC]|uniref:Uncharacterized protein n=1 Tax=Leptospira wolbachii serovar Codice str. CDC TaxID=1218599 RepID=R9A4A7_9LEPT|nr:hypothetical protein [Leptospira wolbachii]EOQ96937.1 hypothetical protein LEP1GSC195_2247 [Leptospira wolbachii serovar Codice str. CDC]